jgi:hypothetical protein
MEFQLFYSKTHAIEKHGPFFRGGAGFDMAIDDDGQTVAYIAALKSDEEIREYKQKYPDAVLMGQVSRVRCVASNGIPCHQPMWKKWGYTGTYPAHLLGSIGNPVLS